MRRGAPGAKTTLQYAVRDVQSRKDLRVACGHVEFTLAPHETAFVRLTPLPGSCTPQPAAPCTAPPPPPTPAGSCVAPLSPPAGYTNHAVRGYYAHPVGENKGTLSIAACAALCSSAGGDCAAFHVFFAPAQSCDVGTCYVHGEPLDSFVPNAEAIAYDKQAQA